MLLSDIRQEYWAGFEIFWDLAELTWTKLKVYLLNVQLQIV